MRTRKRTILRTLIDVINPYAWVMAVRNLAFDTGVLKSHTFGLPVICVGNISVGGTGKTPHTEYIIKLLKQRCNTALLSRGYGRKSKGYIKADAHTPMQLIGDEPFQIKNKIPNITVAVCEKRVTGIERLLAEEKEVQAIILDDAYQHRYVKAGLNILLIDSNRPVWNDNVLPFGRLRESLRGISRANIIILTKCEGLTPQQADWYRQYIKKYSEAPLYFSSVRYGEPYKVFGSDKATITPQSNVLLVTGIATPRPLKAEMERRGATVTLMQYPDHHNFSTAELDEIAAQYKKQGCTMLLTTEKDATRLLGRNDIPQLIMQNICALPIEVEILNGEEELFNQKIYDYVAENSRNS